MRVTLAGVTSESRGSRVAVTTTSASAVASGCTGSTPLSPALAASGTRATRVMVIRMIGWPIIATNDYPCHGDSEQESGKDSIACCHFPRHGTLIDRNACAGGRAPERDRASPDRAGALGWRRARRGTHWCAESARRESRSGRCHRRHQHGCGGGGLVCLGPLGGRHRARHDLGGLAGRVSRPAGAQGPELPSQARGPELPRQIPAGTEEPQVPPAARPGAGAEAHADPAQPHAAGVADPGFRRARHPVPRHRHRHRHRRARGPGSR